MKGISLIISVISLLAFEGCKLNPQKTKSVTLEKQAILSLKAPKPIGPYSQAIRTGDLVFISGQIALNNFGVLDTSNIKNETAQVMKNLEEILKESGMTFKNVVKTTIYLRDMNKFSEVNQVYAGFIENTIAPARETIEVSALPKGANIEISMIAVQQP